MTDSVDAKKHKLEMTHGSTTHSQYAIIARNGNVVMAIRLYPPNIIHFGDLSRVRLAVRLRIHTEGVDDAEETVVSLKDNIKVSLDDAFPHVDWETTDSTRKASWIGTYFKGNLNDALVYTAKTIAEKKYIRNFSKILHTAAGKHAVVSQMEIADFLSSEVDVYLKTVEQFIKVKSGMDEFAIELDGSVGFLGQILNKKYQSLVQATDEGLEEAEEESKNA